MYNSDDLPELAIALVVITRSLMQQPNFDKGLLTKDLKEVLSHHGEDKDSVICEVLRQILK